MKLWRQQEENSELHLLQELPPFAEAVWRLSWNVMGNILAVTTGDNKVCKPVGQDLLNCLVNSWLVFFEFGTWGF